MFKSIAVAAGLMLGLVVLVPLALCLAYSIGALGSIGPWVPAWGIATLVCAPFAAYLPLAG